RDRARAGGARRARFRGSRRRARDDARRPRFSRRRRARRRARGRAAGPRSRRGAGHGGCPRRARASRTLCRRARAFRRCGRVATASKAASVALAHWSLGRAGLLLARPPTESLDVEPLIEAALADARAQGVSGQAVTPFVLAHIHRETAGASVRINKRLIADNA